MNIKWAWQQQQQALRTIFVQLLKVFKFMCRGIKPSKMIDTRSKLTSVTDAACLSLTWIVKKFNNTIVLH